MTTGSVNLPAVSGTVTNVTAAGTQGVTTAVTSGTTIPNITVGLSARPHCVYVDFLSGNDSTGSGGILSPWKTLQHAYDSISPTLSAPITIYLSGGAYAANNDTDVAPITGKPNTTLVADNPTRIEAPFVISGGSTNDTCTFYNCFFFGGSPPGTTGFSWVRNDATVMTLNFINCLLNFGVSVQQTGAGAATVSAYNTVFGYCSFVLPFFQSWFYNCTFYNEVTFDDQRGTAPVTSIATGYINNSLIITGQTLLQMSALQADVNNGYTLTITTNAHGTPSIQTDSTSYPDPAYITGTPSSITFFDNALYESYTPAVAGDWNVQPTTVAGALDMIAATLGPI
jgi:hypothetical protein